MFRSARSNKAEKADPPPTFWRRNRRLIVVTFWNIFAFGVIITIFQAPTYRSVAIVAPPRGSDPVAERVRLVDPRLIADIQFAATPTTDDAHRDAPRMFLIANSTDNTGGIALAAESEDPRQATFAVNHWASEYVAQSEVSGRGEATVAYAATPTAPIRPKKGQNILFSALLGLTLGLIFAVIREELRRIRSRP